GVGGVPDNQLDTVNVKGTDSNDKITVAGSAASVNVTGLAATIDILHPDATDELKFDTGAGKDTVDPSGLAGGVVQLSVTPSCQPGPGRKSAGAHMPVGPALQAVDSVPHRHAVDPPRTAVGVAAGGAGGTGGGIGGGGSSFGPPGTCLRYPHLVAVRCRVDSRQMRHVSVSCSSLQLAKQDS